VKPNIENNRPWLICSAANAYHDAGFILLGSRRPDMHEPALTCQAFSLELYLKCLITMHAGTTPRHHNIAKLFEQCSPKHQEMMRTFYLGYFASEPAELAVQRRMKQEFPGIPDPRDLPAVLVAASTGYEKLRYNYEPPSGDPGYFQGQLLRAARQAVFTLQPDWSRIGTIKEQIAPPPGSQTPI
jgi:hypothetical protein